MHTTIFCTFDHQDLADLAMGHIRAIDGVKTIHYIHGPDRRKRHGGPLVAGELPAGALAGISSGSPGWFMTNSNMTYSHATVPHPVTVKITCTDDARKRVVGRLVNQHASHIILTPR